MHPRLVNLICVLAAVAGISFGAGSVAQGGSAQQTRTAKVKDSTAHRWLIEANTNLALMQAQLYAICKNIREQAAPNPYGSAPSCEVGPFTPTGD